ncbi:NB-ARC domain-containing protein [Microcoleus sp. FACHB-672]|uniref:NB-ARC domain-containing protein n=1 Tax=Microcoleus sp. FACHB-672 TaxID=2692825 RepID=UPI0016875FC4|nr:NB-ARC domain-containing protein [Microcoleus sp. FACHB-672]MBD2043357.1 hypothetical protein [Microcoleus sp. FACHB-672]
MATLKASRQGLAKIRQKRKELGWPIGDHRWLEEASSILGVSWEEKGYLADGISEGTWSRFLKGKEGINTPAFKAYCQVLTINWEEVANPLERQDWDSAPDVSVFYGRTEELGRLEEWIVKDHCRVVALLGIGGIGKTTLSVKLAKQIQDDFKSLIWRSLRGDPPLQDLLGELILSLSNQHKTDLSHTLEGRLSQLMECLRSQRCLVVLDNWETVLDTGSLAGHPRQGYEGYGELLKRVGESQHNSCFVLTSWEKPKEIAAIEGPNLPVRSWKLKGLGSDAKNILKEKGLQEESLWEELIQLYKGNPFALKIVATTIKDLFDGGVSDFLNGTLFLGDFEYLLSEQFERLSQLEKKFLVYLGNYAEPVSRSQLQDFFCSEISVTELLKALESLNRRCLVEKINNENGTFFTLQPALAKYVTRKYK